MAQKLAIIAEIKRTLKERDITYAQVARHMKLSLPSVKRLLSTGDLSLDRLDQICELLGMEVTELVEQMRQREAPVTRLTNAQEREIIADPRLFFITWLVLNRWRIEDIVEAFKFTPAEVERYLIKLDRLKLIELQPGNRARLRVNSNISWQAGGPMWRYVHQNLLKEFFASDFQDSRAEFRFYGSIMSEATLLQIKRTIQNVLRECAELADRDRTLPLDKRTGAAYVFALRPWQYTGFDQFRRPKGT
jgi:transcriptional regulator with XRE-family HTH domain